MNSPSLSRRGLLRAAGGIALAASAATMLAACGSTASTTPLTASASSSALRPRKGGTLSAAFIDGSNASPSVLLATQTALAFTLACGPGYLLSQYGDAGWGVPAGGQVPGPVR